jgi:tetratricopeptide (TPR) repeat protein
MANLLVNIGADVSGLQKALAIADRELQKIDTSSKRVAEGINRLNQESKNYELQLSKLNQQLKTGVISESDYSKASEIVTAKIAETRQEIIVYQRELDRLTNSQRSRIQALEAQAVKETEVKNVLENTNVATQKNIGSVNALRNTIITTILPTNQFSGAILRTGGSLAQLSKQAGGTAGAIKLIGTSFLGPAGIALAASSALAAGIALVSEKTRESREENEKLKTSTDRLKEAQDRFNESLENTDQLLGRKIFTDFLLEIGALEKTFIDTGNGSGFFVNKVNENINVLEGFGDRVKTLRRGELELFKKFFTVELVEAQRALNNLDPSSLEATLTTEKVVGFEQALGLVNNELQLFIDAENKLKEAIKKTNTEIDNQTKKTGLIFELRQKIREFEDKKTFAKDEKELALIVERIQKYTQELKLLEKRAELLGRPIVAEDRGFADPSRATDFLTNVGVIIPDETLETFENQKQQYINGIAQISSAFASLGVDVAGVFGNLDQGQERFLQSFLRFAGQVISQQFAISQGYAIQGAFAAGAAKGPFGLVLTPGLIAGALGLVASSFGLLKSGVRGGNIAGGNVGSGVGSTFEGGGTQFLSNNIELALVPEITGDAIRFVLDKSNQYRN